MRLFPVPHPLESEEVRQQQEAEALWAVVRGEGKSDSTPDLRATALISEAVRDVMVRRDMESSLEAAGSFHSTHERLMKAIAASRPIEDAASIVRQDAAPVSAFAPLRAQPLRKLPLSRLLSPRIRGFRYAAFALLLVGAVFYGRHSAQLESPYFPMALMVADYDKQVRLKENSFDLRGNNTRLLEAELSPQMGMQVRLPEPGKFGARLLGVRTTQYDGVPTVEAHFEQGGTRVAFVQARAPQRSLRWVTETRLNGRVYLLREVGVYRVVAWREDDSVLAVVSPLDQDQSLKVAERIRASVPSEDTA
jgi:hypothetical protein